MADKALLLGINTYKKVNSLRGCVNDVENMRKLLTEVFGFSQANVKVLLNDKVVKKDVKTQLSWLFKDGKPNDRVVLHYSGHGSQTADLDGDEEDGADELVCLYDMDFDDPESYLLDDELREWTTKLPAGVHLTVVLDSCHSGTGTRMLMAPVAGKPNKKVPMMVDPKATVDRALAGKAQARGLGASEAALLATDPDHEDLVRVRYVEPPQKIKDAIESRKKTPARGLVVAKMNHVLLAGCGDDQTSADATIDGTPNGAFTYHLCKTIRAGGAKLDRKELIDRVEKALHDGHFTQVPQLESASEKGPLFGDSRGVGDVAEPAPAPSPSPIVVTAAQPSGGVDQLKSLIPTIALLAPDAQVEALRMLGSRAGAQAALTAATRGVGDRFLVYVHGICKHSAGYSDDWWNALHPFTQAFGAGDRDGSRREVLWSDLVNERGLAMKAARAVDPQAARQAAAQAQVEAEIREALQDRVDRHMLDAGPKSAAGAAPRALADARGLSIPGLNCIDDFTVYMVDDAVRAQIIERFTSVVRPLLESGAELDILSHSWGTVVAYEALRELADGGATEPRIRNFFTVGAALSIGPVKMRLRPGNRDGRRPAMVRRWVNLNAHGDVVGGPLQGRPYEVDDDFPNLDPVGCGSFLGLINPACAHGSYFVAGNDAVNRDIFAAFIDQA